MSLNYDQSLLRPTGRVLSTMEQDGSRRWLRPKLSKGRFWKRRRWVGYGLIALFAGLPYIPINGKPAILLDLAHRQFTLFGYTFLPTDTALLALFMVAAILTIFFVTALLGRVWCGWGCPQTVYMEYLFRPIERLCTGRSGVGGEPRGTVAPWRYALMYAIYAVVSLLLAHVFLAYFVGVEQLAVWVRRSPLEHPASFLIVASTAALIFFDFGFFREQTCHIACPYGRIQSVLTDRQSLTISYDPVRGEPRGPMKRVSLGVLGVEEKKTGDCVDCDMCVSVCPAGIDIRDGAQFECIGCTQCIDACDAVMSKVGRAVGLIRYTSEAALAGEPTRILRPRVIIYSAIIVALVALMTFLLLTKSAADVTVLRSGGRPFVVTDQGLVENVMRVKITNRSDRALAFSFSVPSGDIKVVGARQNLSLNPGEVVTEPLTILAPASTFTIGSADVVLRVADAAAGVSVDTKCRILGPIGAIPE